MTRKRNSKNDTNTTEEKEPQHEVEQVEEQQPKKQKVVEQEEEEQQQALVPYRANFSSPTKSSSSSSSSPSKRMSPGKRMLSNEFWFTSKENKPVTITRSSFKKFMKQKIAERISKNPRNELRYSDKAMLVDLQNNIFEFYTFFPREYLEMFDASFDSAAYSKIYKTGVRCRALQPYGPLEFVTPPLRAYFAKLAPLGNFHPQGLNWAPKAVGSAYSTIKISLQESNEQPQFNDDIIDFRNWLGSVVDDMIRWTMWYPKSKPYQLLVEQGFKPHGTEEEQQAYINEFMTHVRPLYDDEGDYPYRINAKRKLITQCSETAAIEFETKPYPIPGNLSILRYEHLENRPPVNPKTGIQHYYVVQDVPIYENGKLILMKDRPECKAYDDKKQFIDPSERSSIVNGEWDSFKLRLNITYMKDEKTDKWTVGGSLELIDIRKVQCTDVKPKKDPLYYENEVTEETIPRVPMVPHAMDGDMTDELLRMQQSLLADVLPDMDKDMLDFDIDQAVDNYKNKKNEAEKTVEIDV